MSNVMIFEDKVTTPSSVLMLNATNGSFLRFSGTNVKLKRELNRAMKNGASNILLFIDVSTNNKTTVDLYQELLKTVVNNQWETVHVIPIPCIEYYIIKMLVSYRYLSPEELDDEVVQFVVTGHASVHLKNIVLNGSTVENICKGYLHNKCRLCLRNRNKENPKPESYNYNWFYTKDCANCENCIIQCCATQAAKSEQLFTSLPVFFMCEEIRDFVRRYAIDAKSISLDEVKQLQQDLYDQISEELNIPKITIYI